MPELINKTLGQLLDSTALKYADKDAIVFCDLNYKLTYKNFKKLIDEIAKGLLALHVQKGEHIGVFAVNCPEWVILQFASAKAGAVLVNINPALKSHELKYILEQGNITTLFLTEQFKNQNMIEVLKTVGAVHGLPLRKIITIRTNKYPEYMKWEDLYQLAKGISDEDLIERENQLDSKDIINIQYTSGTTGFPKGAQLTHSGILNNAYFCGLNMHLTDKDSVCIPVPLYHCFGCVLGTLVCVNYGIKMVFPSEVFDPQKTLEAVHKEKCTALYGVPTMFISELALDDFNNYNLMSLRTGVIAGAPCPMELMKQLIEKMNLTEITIGYGFTEASPLITQTRYNDPIELKVGTVGKAHQNVKVKIIDPEIKEEVPFNTAGELCAYGYNAMKGYYKMPDKTKEVIDSEGWMHTGDLATMDKDGVCRIVGRIKDMIIRGGENIYPAEVEEFFMTNSKVEIVQVVGIPDQKFGEQAAAVIKLKPNEKWTEEEAKEWCKGKIATFKIPYHIKFVNEFPMTANGKIQKYRIREMLQKELKILV
ncbi:MAG: AMP-binding protein [Candidatus Melainabacteria bacterium RIFCSPLOWO2_12_FULL_35_11]|nr:MAG: AMP-binding protein [Candidatus Melainabacteria bacterium RIFCSPLOWO2_12_FULL_35_11]